jgi:hypothetical protein
MSTLLDDGWDQHTQRTPRRYQVWHMRQGRGAWLGASDDLDEACGLARTRKPAAVYEGMSPDPLLHVDAKGRERGPLGKPGRLARMRAHRELLSAAADGTRVKDLGLSARRARRVLAACELPLRLEEGPRGLVVRRPR